MKMTTDYLENKEETTKKRLELLSARFERLKNDNGNDIIEEEFEIPDAESIILVPKGTVENKKILEEFNETKKEYDKKLKDQIYENSRKLADMILDIDCSSYESIDENDKENKYLQKNVYKKNIERTIRLRNIMKKRDDSENDNLGINNIAKFKEERRENDNQLIKTLGRLGVPNFVKTKFKKATIERYKIVNGKFFGVIV